MWCYKVVYSGEIRDHVQMNYGEPILQQNPHCHSTPRKKLVAPVVFLVCIVFLKVLPAAPRGRMFCHGGETAEELKVEESIESKIHYNKVKRRSISMFEGLTIQIGNLNIFFCFSIPACIWLRCLASINPPMHWRWKTFKPRQQTIILNWINLWWMDQIMIRDTNKLWSYAVRCGRKLFYFSLSLHSDRKCKIAMFSEGSKMDGSWADEQSDWTSWLSKVTFFNGWDCCLEIFYVWAAWTWSLWLGFASWKYCVL